MSCANALQVEQGLPPYTCNKNADTVFRLDSKRFKLIDRDKERALIDSYQKDKNQVALNRLVNAHMRMVIMLAGRYRTSFRDMSDLVQEGSMGLHRAIDRFDPGKGVKLTTFAGWWIRAYIGRYVQNNRSMVNVATTADKRKLLSNLGKAEEKLRVAGKEVTSLSLAKYLGAKLADVEAIRMLRAGRQEASLDAQDVDNEGTEYDARWMTCKQALQDEILETNRRDIQLSECLKEFIESLNERDSFILERRWMDDDPMTLDELSKHFGVTRERIRQLEVRMLNKLKVFLLAEMPGYFEDCDPKRT